MAFGFDAVSDYPFFEFSKKEVMRAGERIAGDLLWTAQSAPEIQKAFFIANRWRDSHAYPMKSVRLSLAAFMRMNGIEGSVVSRLKRMQAIRKKLSRENSRFTLNQLQDLGGCRVIVNSISDVDKLSKVLKSRLRHEVKRDDDYINSPKPDGYRSHHLILSYFGKGGAAVYNGRSIEVQVRTRLQHSWATAVESIGAFRREDLKGNKGDQDWLRLFRLISGEFALAEARPESPDLPPHLDRVKERVSLHNKLMASNTLDNLSYAVEWVRQSVQSLTKPLFYLISYNNSTRKVHVEPYFTPESATRAYDMAESSDNKTGLSTTNVVLVAADKLDTVRFGYKNYFGDVHDFRDQLKMIIGEQNRDFDLIPQESVRPPFQSDDNPDLSWLRRSRFRKPKGS